MNHILNTILMDNPQLHEEVYKFCNQLPEFRAAEQAYETMAAAIRAQLGAAEYNAFDDTLNWYLAQYTNAYYLFGLHLRQDLISALI